MPAAFKVGSALAALSIKLLALAILGDLKAVYRKLFRVGRMAPNGAFPYTVNSIAGNLRPIYRVQVLGGFSGCVLSAKTGLPGLRLSRITRRKV
jgi:hypothetical protein